MCDAKYIRMFGGCGLVVRAAAFVTLCSAAEVVMSIKELLQGKWLGHPLHPALVHLPTGLWPSALIFDIGTHFARLEVAGAMELASRWCIAGGVLVALVAAPAGLADWWDIKPDKPARRLGWWHMGINFVV